MTFLIFCDAVGDSDPRRSEETSINCRGKTEEKIKVRAGILTQNKRLELEKIYVGP